MTKKYLSIIIGLILFTSFVSEAQVVIGGYYRPYPPRPRRPVMVQRQQQRKLPSFQPSVNINLGYGFPNLDKNQLADFYGEYKGTATQTGPFLGSIDYQFSRFMSIGALGTYGKISVPYYNYNVQAAQLPDFTGKMESWSLMLNIMNYIPTYDNHVTPYFRTAIGISNIINQSYNDATGAPVTYADNSSQLAYQVSLGARFKLSPNAGFFLEAGYGRYIAAAGLSFKF